MSVFVLSVSLVHYISLSLSVFQRYRDHRDLHPHPTRRLDRVHQPPTPLSPTRRLGLEVVVNGDLDVESATSGTRGVGGRATEERLFALHSVEYDSHRKTNSIALWASGSVYEPI